MRRGGEAVRTSADDSNVAEHTSEAHLAKRNSKWQTQEQGLGRWTRLHCGKCGCFPPLIFRIEIVNDAVTLKPSEGYASTVILRAFDFPTAALFDKAHVISASPPIIDFARKRYPHS